MLNGVIEGPLDLVSALALVFASILALMVFFASVWVVVFAPAPAEM